MSQGITEKIMVLVKAPPFCNMTSIANNKSQNLIFYLSPPGKSKHLNLSTTYTPSLFQPYIYLSNCYVVFFATLFLKSQPSFHSKPEHLVSIPSGVSMFIQDRGGRSIFGLLLNC